MSAEVARLRPALFTRPLPLAAMALLVVNDHVMKGAGVVPGWLTGKLSDFAGLFFAPLLLAELWLLLAPARTTEAALTRVHLAAIAVGITFLAIKVSSVASGLYVAGVGAILGVLNSGAANVTDSSDLLALPMLLAAIYYSRAQPGFITSSRTTVA